MGASMTTIARGSAPVMVGAPDSSLCPVRVPFSACPEKGTKERAPHTRAGPVGPGPCVAPVLGVGVSRPRPPVGTLVLLTFAETKVSRAFSVVHSTVGCFRARKAPHRAPIQMSCRRTVPRPRPTPLAAAPPPSPVATHPLPAAPPAWNARCTASRRSSSPRPCGDSGLRSAHRAGSRSCPEC